MTKDISSKRIYLKSVSIYPNSEGKTRLTTFELLKAVHSKAKGRFPSFEISNLDKRIIYINRCDVEEGYLFGELVMESPGRSQEILVGKPNKKKNMQKDKRSIKASDAIKDESAEYNEGSLWFYCYGNTLFILQSKALRASKLEKYLTNLLVKNELLEEEEIILLGNEMSSKLKEGLSESSVKEVYIGDTLNWDSDGVMDPNTKALSKFLGAKDLLGKTHGTSNIKFNLQLHLDKKDMKNSQSLFDKISYATRDIPHSKHIILLRNGTKLEGNDVFASTVVDIKSKNGNLLYSSIKDAMIDWDKELAEESDFVAT